MLAFLALLVAMVFFVNQQRAAIRTEREIVSLELEMMASSLASDMMQVFAQKEFDRATDPVTGTVTPRNQNKNDLANAPFVTGKDCGTFDTDPPYQNCPYLEDFAGMQPDTLFFEVKEDAGGDPVGMSFAVTAEVHYVDADGQPTNTKTWMKEVVLLLDHAPAPGEFKHPMKPVRITRRFSPQW